VNTAGDSEKRGSFKPAHREKKGSAFADPALEATEGIVIWEGNYTPDILFSELFPINFNVFSSQASLYRQRQRQEI
jgi:hypothetical protein